MQSDPDVAKAMNAAPKIVISRTLAQATWAGPQVISTGIEEELALFAGAGKTSLKLLKTQRFNQQITSRLGHSGHSRRRRRSL